jgi:hypothetical protein
MNKQHFEEKKMECVQHVKKNSVCVFVEKYIKWGVWRVVVCLSYIQDARFLKVNV